MAPSRKLTSTAGACASVTAVIALLQQHQRKKRIWARQWLQRRDKKSIYHSPVAELSLEDTESFYNFHRMDKKHFIELLEMVGHIISKQDTQMRKAVTMQERFCLHSTCTGMPDLRFKVQIYFIFTLIFM